MAAGAPAILLAFQPAASFSPCAQWWAGLTPTLEDCQKEEKNGPQWREATVIGQDLLEALGRTGSPFRCACAPEPYPMG